MEWSKPEQRLFPLNIVPVPADDKLLGWVIKARRFCKGDSLLAIQLYAGFFPPSIEFSVFVVPDVRE